MGQHADDALDRTWDDIESGAAYDTDYIKHHHITCRRCGKTGLEWSRTSKGWRLFDHGTIHSCTPKQ